jgi:BCD family chlorophyll transporter-like MFS transporter
MRRLHETMVTGWTRIAPRFLPFADAATPQLPLSRLIRLAGLQVSVGMATALLLGTLNRVMIVELGVAAWLVALMVAIPVVIAPLRAVVGYRSDFHRSFLGWRRVPYIWLGTLVQFGGLAIMPFALLILSGDAHGPAWTGQAGAALAFLMVGAGLQTSQTAGLALAADLADDESRPRVVALMYVMLLAGMVASGFAFGLLLEDFSAMRLIQVIQGAAVVTMLLNLAALWKQEPRDPARTVPGAPRPSFAECWRRFTRGQRAVRFLVAVGLGTAAFNMQDIILEPYGAQVLGLGVGATATLTALVAIGSLAAVALAARRLARGFDPYRLAAHGVLAGILAFAAVVFADPLESSLVFRAGVVLIGFGGGLFYVGLLTAAMALDTTDLRGLALGAWGAVQAFAAGGAIALGGALRDAVTGLAQQGLLGPGLAGPGTGYSFVYHLEIALLFATLVVLGPLVRASSAGKRERPPTTFGLAEFPG